MIVSKVIRDNRNESWPDASPWYWNSLVGASTGPWWSFVVADKSSSKEDVAEFAAH